MYAYLKYRTAETSGVLKSKRYVPNAKDYG
jgi:hypothetical protein